MFWKSKKLSEYKLRHLGAIKIGIQPCFPNFFVGFTTNTQGDKHGKSSKPSKIHSPPLQHQAQQSQPYRNRWETELKLTELKPVAVLLR